jgi:hypothetical protein
MRANSGASPWDLLLLPMTRVARPGAATAAAPMAIRPRACHIATDASSISGIYPRQAELNQPAA